MIEDHVCTDNLPARGARIRLDCMPNDPDPIPSGTCGTVAADPVPFGDFFQIPVQWDDRERSLYLVVPPDQFTVIE